MVDIIISEKSKFWGFRIISLAQMRSGIISFPFSENLYQIQREK